MAREHGNNFPFEPPTEYLGFSEQSEVMGWPDSSLVVKIKNSSREPVFASINQAVESIHQREALIRQAREEISSLGSNPDTIPKIYPVIHSATNREGITWTKTQKRFSGAETLSQAGVNIFRLPTQSLTDLRNIFLYCAECWMENRETGITIDLVGSSKNCSRPRRIFNHFMPLFGSTNIIIDSDQVPRFIDISFLFKGQAAKEKVRRTAEVVGTIASIGILSSIIGVRKLANSFKKNSLTNPLAN